MITELICPDGGYISKDACLTQGGCRMGTRCLTLPTLHLATQERPWNGVASTTQLLNGTMHEFLRLSYDYAVDPDKRMFMLEGTNHHDGLEKMAKVLNLPSEIPLSIDRDVFDLLEPDEDQPGWVLSDYKLWGSYKVAKAIGVVEDGKKPNPNGELYKSSGKWGKAGTPKMLKNFRLDPSASDCWEAVLQLNRYRVMLKELGIGPINRMQVQSTVRDGGSYLAKGRGVERNTAMIPIEFMPDSMVAAYFETKQANLAQALSQGSWTEICTSQENWDGRRCVGYCDVAHYCPRNTSGLQDNLTQEQIEEMFV